MPALRQAARRRDRAVTSRSTACSPSGGSRPAIVATVLTLVAAAAPLPIHAADPAASAPAPAQRRPLPLTRETAEQRRNMFESGWPGVEAALKRWRGLTEGPRDFRGVAPAADIKAYVLTAEERETLDGWRAEAQRQFDGGDWPGAILLYGNLINQANEVVSRLRQVSGYWVWNQTHERRMARWHRAVRANDLDDPHGARLEALEAGLKEQVRARQFGEPGSQAMREIDALFRQAVAEARAAAPGGVLRDDPMRRTPRKPCDDGRPDMPVAPPESIRIAARLNARQATAPGTFYPLVARFTGIEGMTAVRALVAPSGCLVYAEILTSSGSDLLDDAAMEWAVDGGKFTSATGVDGSSLASVVQFNVRFKLND